MLLYVVDILAGENLKKEKKIISLVFLLSAVLLEMIIVLKILSVEAVMSDGDPRYTNSLWNNKH